MSRIILPRNYKIFWIPVFYLTIRMNFFTFISHVVSFQFKLPLFIFFLWGLQTQWLERSGFVKRLAGATTQQNPIVSVSRPMTEWTRTRPIFFSNVVFLLCPYFFFFFSWLLTLFKVHYINIRKIFYFFMWDLKPFSIYTLCPKKKIIFSMWDLKPFRIYTLCSQEKSYVFSM